MVSILMCRKVINKLWAFSNNLSLPLLRNKCKTLVHVTSTRVKKMIAMWNIMVGHVFALDTYTLHSIWTIRLWRICLLLSWLMTDISITQPFVSSKLNLKKHTKKEENPPPNLRFEMPQLQQILRFWSWLRRNNC